MTLRQTREIILTWIDSCTTSEQLDILVGVVDSYVAKRFEDDNGVTEFELSICVSDLTNAINNRRLIVVRDGLDKRMEEEQTPTLAAYLHKKEPPEIN